MLCTTLIKAEWIGPRDENLMGELRIENVYLLAQYVYHHI